MPFDRHSAILEEAFEGWYKGGPHTMFDEVLNTNCRILAIKSFTPINKLCHYSILLFLIVSVKDCQNLIQHIYQIMSSRQALSVSILGGV